MRLQCRYQRPTGEPCTRFAEGKGHPPCKQNDMTWCHTDLTAVVYRWQTLMDSGLRFGLMDPTGVAADAVMAQQAKARGWKVRKMG